MGWSPRDSERRGDIKNVTTDATLSTGSLPDWPSPPDWMRFIFPARLRSSCGQTLWTCCPLRPTAVDQSPLAPETFAINNGKHKAPLGILVTNSQYIYMEIRTSFFLIEKNPNFRFGCHYLIILTVFHPRRENKERRQ